MSTLSPQRFTILHVTDIHEGNTLYPRLAAYLTSHPTHPRQIDLIAVTGDQLNLMHPLEGHLPGGRDYIPADEVARAAWKAVMFDGVAGTLRAQQKYPLPRVLWIPGNHDPVESFARQDPDAWLGEAKAPEGVVPAHEKMIRLAPGLVAVGVGGSVPAYWSEGAGNGKEGQEVWPGCPWRSEEQLKQESLLPHIIPLMQEAVDNGDQVVFLTHSGPATSATTLIRTDATEPDPIWKFYHHVNSGSPSLLDILHAPPKPTSGGPVTHPLIPLVLHGHSHWSRGVHRINASTVVNPGSFKDCAAGLIELRRDAASGQWKVGTVELIEF